MEKLLTFVYSHLSSLGYSIYDKKPPEGTEYPFIEYGINETFRNVNPKLYTLTIDVWDRGNSTYQVETIASQIDLVLEDLSYSNTDTQVKVKRQSRLKLEDTDATLKRRQLNYQLRVFYK